MSTLDETHDPELRSWIASANAPGQDFPIQNLPLGVLRGRGSARWRIGVAIGDQILDVSGAAQALSRHASQPARAALQAVSEPPLNALMSEGRGASGALRLLLSRALREHAPERALLEEHLLPQAQAQYALPARVGDYTDFYASIHHATAVGRLFRPDRPLLPNYEWMPIAYHGRSSSLCVSGTPITRPAGQRLPPGQSPAHPTAAPQLGPSERLDYELELGVFIGAGNALGSPIAVQDADQHVFGLCLLNDWSARDLQSWEYQPLGPFLAKNFATTLSPWVVTAEALEPYRCAWGRAAGHPAPLPYLDDARLRLQGGLDIELQVLLQTTRMRQAGESAAPLSRSNFRDSFWCIAQLLAHHTVNGCNLLPGDLLGTGTQSGPEPEQAGCLLELTRGGREPLQLPNGETRRFLEDGDAVTLRAWCERPGSARIGFGEASGEVRAAALTST